MTTHSLLTGFSLAAVTILASSSIGAYASEPPTPSALADKISTHHGLASWHQQADVKSQMTVVFGGQTIIDHHFVFEATDAKARMDDAAENSVIYDGSQAWATPTAEATPNGRFHVLTWPWFLRAPLTVKEPWQNLGPVSKHAFNGIDTWLTRQTFAADAGDSPDDWYDLIVDPQSGQLLGMYYIVTYGKSAEEANKSVSLIEYTDYRDVNGVSLSHTWTLWKVDAESREKIGEPKATVSVKDVQFLSAGVDRYVVPEKAVALPLP